MRAAALVGAGAWAAILLAGCTIYPEHKNPTLATTTSAEQTQRIFWKDVEAGKWTEVNALLAPNVVWRTGSRVLDRHEIVPWLKGLGVQTALLTGVTVKSNVNDMTLVYALQVKGRERVVSRDRNAASVADCLQNLHAVAVWQQPPSGNSGEGGGYLLTVEDLVSAPPEAPRASGSQVCAEE